MTKLWTLSTAFVGVTPSEDQRRKFRLPLSAAMTLIGGPFNVSLKLRFGRQAHESHRRNIAR
jgi:hypothetical protein